MSSPVILSEDHPATWNPESSNYTSNAKKPPNHVRRERNSGERTSTIADQTANLPTASESDSLDHRLRDSTISDPRHAANQSTRTQRSTAPSHKRSGDEMTHPPSDTRPKKQLFSPSSSRQNSFVDSTAHSKGHSGPDTFVTHTASPHQGPGPLLPPAHKGLENPISVPGPAPETVLVKQPATRPITEQQLINEVKGIYAGLVMVEKKCVEIVAQQSQSTKRLSDQQWKALVALHRTLLQEHHDFFSASQHPTASEALKKLAVKYAMPARMWRHGIHAFLELLRHRLPDSMEHMLSFIYLAYSMMALLKESVPSFVETWIECLGDLARYRMAIEDSDPRDREIWSNVAKMWYNEAADKSPNVGRIQHHLAVLARPNIVEQLFYYDKALVSIVPFTNARESIMLLFDMFLKNNEAVHNRYPPTEYAFVYFYALLFTCQLPAECRKALDIVRSSFGSHMDRAGVRFKMQGPQMAAALFAALLDFGREHSYLWERYERLTKGAEAPQKAPEGQSSTPIPPDTNHKFSDHKRYWTTLTFTSPVERLSFAAPIFDKGTISNSTDVVALAALMVMETVSLVSSRMGDKNVVPFMHVVLANLYDLSFVAGALVYIEGCIPWSNLALFLNTVGRSGVSHSNVESENFPPSHGGHGKQLPEDFIMRGTMTSCHYYESDFFAGPLVDDDERTIELPSHQAPRAERCLWLGVRLSQLGRYLTYNLETKQFEATDFAKSLASIHD